ncbi:Peroxiredoxin-5 like protein [Verticillium longisporum]|uniref:Peroxiredoxin-5 like protein n=1 Tax=Verticillium longisporum TaxID=100787 RepID=A0A8I2ZP88_VERLO|nr:Peroxiredoxin-5 like protein [Verticillium longisporum]
MAFRAVARRAAFARPAVAARAFHSTPRAFVRVGDEIPDLNVLVEDSPANKVNLADEFKSANGLIIGVPAAFSGTCSASHVPSYINHPKLKEAGSVFVVSVNDPFVWVLPLPTAKLKDSQLTLRSMKAWADQMDPAQQTGIRFLGDPTAEFTKALNLGWDGSAIFGGIRSKRYALVVENGTVKSAHVEPDNTGTAVSMADKVLG